MDGLLGGRLDTARFMSSVSDEAAGPIISRLAMGKPYTGIVNLPNAGQIANLPPDVVVETMGVLEPSGARGISVGALPREIQSIVAGHVANQEAIVDAALCGDRRLALAALAADPLIASLDDAERMLDEMLAANRRWLPRFF